MAHIWQYPPPPPRALNGPGISSCVRLKWCWLEIPRHLLMFGRWTRHHKQLKTFLRWSWNVFPYESERFYTKRPVHKEKKICHQLTRLTDVNNGHLMFNNGIWCFHTAPTWLIDQLLWAAIENFNWSFHRSLASSGNKKIDDNLYRGFNDARMNPDKCRYLHLISVNKEILNPQITIEYIRIPVVEAKKRHQTSSVSLWVTIEFQQHALY